MAKIRIDGLVFYGDKFEIKNGGIYIDDKLVFKSENDSNLVSIEGNGNIECNTAIIEGNFTGEIVADKVIINGEHNGEINTNKLIYNK